MLKSLYRSNGYIYQQWDLFEVGKMKKYKTIAWEGFRNCWVDNYTPPAKNPPKVFSSAYDTVKNWMERIKLIDPDARFFYYCTAWRWNWSNWVAWRLYTIYNRKSINQETWQVTDEWEELDYLESYPYDEWKYFSLLLFEDILWLIDVTKQQWSFDIEVFKKCNKEDLDKRKIDVDMSMRNIPNEQWSNSN